MLDKFYKAMNVPEKDRIPLEKNVLFIVPKKGFDLTSVLQRLGLCKYEVAVTWPKQNVKLIDEVMAAETHLVLQVGEVVSRKFHFLPDDGSRDEEFKEVIRGLITDEFVGLHHHDEFSIKDAVGTVNQLIKLLKVQRRSFCCVTNHGSVGGWIKQYNACKTAGVKAIFGIEAYLSHYRGDDIEQRKRNRSANHLLLIARTMEGFENIIKIHNDAQIEGFYYTPRTNYEALQRWGKGIIASTACMAGEFPQLLMADMYDEAKELYEFYASVFDQFYIEIQLIEFAQQIEANRRLIQFAKSVGAPLVLTCDSHYLEPEHAETQDILLCIRQHKIVSDKKNNEDVWNFDVRNLYYRDLAGMWYVFEHGFVDQNGTAYPPFKDDVFTEEIFWEAVGNTRKIALETEDIKLDSKIKLPKLYENSIDILWTKVEEGFAVRGLGQKSNVNEYVERLQREFISITKLGWTDYFLIIEMIISKAKKEFGDFAVGYGRGSAGGSLVSYCLGITDIDPIQYGLLFERFIDESRQTISVCTFDL